MARALSHDIMYLSRPMLQIYCDGPYYSRPSSYHPGGVNAAMCDAAVIWLREDIAYKVYEQLMTSNSANSSLQGPKSDPNAPINYVLQSSDYQ